MIVSPDTFELMVTAVAIRYMECWNHTDAQESRTLQQHMDKARQHLHEIGYITKPEPTQ